MPIFASVLIDQAIEKPLDYLIPPEMLPALKLGSRVAVPLRNQTAKGTIIEMRPHSFFPSALPIAQHLEEESLHLTDLYDLAQWMARYYASPLRKTLQVILPSSVRKKGKPKLQFYIERAASKEHLSKVCIEIRKKSAAQARVLEALLIADKGMLLTELLERAGVTKAPVESLVKQGHLVQKQISIDRSELEEYDFFPTKPKELKSSQLEALQAVQKSLDSSQFSAHLLHGVTGSGKTEVYLQAIDYTLKQGKGVILLVPEISLTAQTIERLKSRFTQKMAILHHRLSIGQRFDAWHAIRKGEISIVLGARSAVFSPVKNLGLIIVDEEHDGSYKQSEDMPAYNARDIAVLRCKNLNAVAVLGSATPSLESYTNALKKKYSLHTLMSRADGATMPSVTLVDMQIEKERQKGRPLFSGLLLDKIKDRFAKGEQTLLFLNRRGYHTQLFCAECNESLQCPHCALSLTFHRGENSLSCHLCGHFLSPPPSICPKCKKGQPLKFRGYGTEQVERALHAILPGIRTLRMDADTTRHKGAHDRMYKQFRSGKADALIGTQMIAKGLHFPSVTLVGILLAESGLSIPDFRASEITFQMLTQVSGRAGRGELAGEVILQTYMPDHPLIHLIQEADYAQFYETEIGHRKDFHFPPFVRIAKLCFFGKDPKETLGFAEQSYQMLKRTLPKTAQIFPVIACGHAKIKDNHRFQCIIKAPSMQPVSDLLVRLPQKKKSVRLLIDIDPQHTFF